MKVDWKWWIDGGDEHQKKKSGNKAISWQCLPDQFFGLWRTPSPRKFLLRCDHNEGNILWHINALQRCHKNEMDEKTVQKTFLWHDNALADKAAQIQKLLANFQLDIFQHTAYSPDLAPSNYYLHPTLHNEFGGHRFHSHEAVQNFVHNYFQKMDGTSNHLGILKLAQRYKMFRCFRFSYRKIASRM